MQEKKLIYGIFCVILVLVCHISLFILVMSFIFFVFILHLSSYGGGGAEGGFN